MSGFFRTYYHAVEWVVNRFRQGARGTECEAREEMRVETREIAEDTRRTRKKTRVGQASSEGLFS
jgi:hypothetical protein